MHREKITAHKTLKNSKISYIADEARRIAVGRIPDTALEKRWPISY